MEESDLENALYKKALGHTATEVVEEFTIDEEGKQVLSKRKITKKYNSPDMTAMKYLFDHGENAYNQISRMSLDELEKEKKRLLKILKESEDEN